LVKAKPSIWLFLMLSGTVLLFVGIAMLLPQPVEAQCGSSASSCKNCHEVNAKHPVNTSGDWHINHAFGDFCAFCHAGNVQAVEKGPAHEDMIYPLSKPKESCQSCHPNDYTDKAQIYAVALGTTLKADGGSGSAGDSGNKSGDSSGAAADVPSQPIPAPGESRASGALIDYNRRYEVEVLGALDSSRLGNGILVGISILLAVVGAGLVWHFEGFGEIWRRARAVPGDDWRKQAQRGDYVVRGPVVPVCQPVAAPPTPMTDLPKGIQKLDAETQATLEKLLADPEHGSAILRALSRLDPVLINSLQALSKTDRDLLLAIVEELGDSRS
jgi:hypothetical protein